MDKLELTKNADGGNVSSRNSKGKTEKEIERIKNVIEKLKGELDQQKKKKEALENFLNSRKQTLFEVQKKNSNRLGISFIQVHIVAKHYF